MVSYPNTPPSYCGFMSDTLVSSYSDVIIIIIIVVVVINKGNFQVRPYTDFVVFVFTPQNYHVEVREQGACTLWALAGNTKTQQKYIAKETTISNICGMLYDSTEKLLHVGKYVFMRMSNMFGLKSVQFAALDMEELTIIITRQGLLENGL